jgi:hypothetical protein
VYDENQFLHRRGEKEKWIGKGGSARKRQQSPEKCEMLQLSGTEHTKKKQSTAPIEQTFSYLPLSNQIMIGNGRRNVIQFSIVPFAVM